jgi:quercetin dioxygenase-like cupin family protein
MEIRRFGPGHRRPDGPPGTQGVSGQIIYRDEQAVVTELAFQRYAIITPHSNQTNTALFIVISGGGFVQVGEERARVNHGEAVVWPPGIIHGAYTDGTEMRVIVVEFMGAANVPETLMGYAADVATGSGARRATRGEGALAERHLTRDEYDSGEGEPW